MVSGVQCLRSACIPVPQLCELHTKDQLAARRFYATFGYAGRAFWVGAGRSESGAGQIRVVGVKLKVDQEGQVRPIPDTPFLSWIRRKPYVDST